MRRLLAECGDVESAVRAHAAAGVGSAHYLLLCDARGAAVTWWDADGFHRIVPRDGWLVASNWVRQGGVPRDDDLRGGCLVRQVAALGATVPERSWFRRVLSASYMPMLNAQAMVLDHRRRHLELARADAGPAALEPWLDLDLGALLAAETVNPEAVVPLPAERPMRHYLLGEP